MVKKQAKIRYLWHKGSAKKRNIPFLLTFDEWYNWWLSHGEDKDLPQDKMHKNKLCMCRFNDTGPYALNNIYCDTNSNNVRVMHRPGWGKKIQTPFGQFNTIRDAAIVLKKHENTMQYYLKKYPNEYYYL